MRALKFIIVSIIVLVAIAFSALGYLYFKHAPSTETEVSLVGLNALSTVHYDEFGIPHIYAENDADAWRTLGYVHARDRLFQMDVLRRVGGGKLAELFGDDVLKIDRLFRTLGTEESAQEAAKLFQNDASQAWQIQAQAYVDGINAYLENNTKPFEYTILGLEPEPFEVVDMYRVVGYMSFSFAMALKTDPLVDKILHKLGKEYLESFSVHSESWHPRMPINNESTPHIDSTDAAMLTSSVHEALNSLQIPLFEGSNSWVIGGKKSKSGKVLFANDPHINYAQPSVWYEAHIETPTTRLYGNFLACFPYPLVGHTNQCAWGLTMFENDDMDLYREKMEGKNVIYKNESVALLSRIEKVKSSSGKELEFTVLTTPHGPIINGILDDKTLTDSIACFWTFREFPMKVMQVAHGFYSANSMDEFKSVLPDLAAPGLNVMYGDADGNYAWWGTAKILKRPGHVNPKLLLDGSTGKDDPIGYYDFEENPRSVNDERGFVHSANNAPEDVDGRYVFGYYYAGQRSEQIMKKLSAQPLWDIEMMKTLALDDESMWYPSNAKIMCENVKPNSVLQTAMLKALIEWDGKHGLDQNGSIIYSQMLYQTLNLALKDDLGEADFKAIIHTLFYLRSVPKFLKTENNPWWDDKSTEEIESKLQILQMAFEESASALSQQLGNDVSKWKWSTVHKLTNEHPMGKVAVLDDFLNVGPMAIAGGEEVINKQAFWIDNGVNYPVKSGPSTRVLIDFADIENSESINPTGQSGNPFSMHYQDQAKLFVEGKWRKQRMNKADIEANTERKVVFSPQK